MNYMQIRSLIPILSGFGRDPVDVSRHYQHNVISYVTMTTNLTENRSMFFDARHREHSVFSALIFWINFSEVMKDNFA